ncbi:threonine aspartase 1-like isoform X1 [Asterias amurensis]|uniref:threonine aspartase 1-like isoform X1 n=2 Tax=Asterias amurensis TaxID=7602 RepID=UPI003AB75B4C
MDEKHLNAGFVAVHLGAGYHAQENMQEYKAVCQKACKQAMELIRRQASALDVIAATVAILEDSAFTNAGIGSNLNLCGNVECDASIMEGTSLLYGAVGAIPSIRNPIKVCQALISEQKKGTLSCGRIQPCFLVGNGALQWAQDHGIKGVSMSSLLTKNSLKAYRKHKRRLSDVEQGVARTRNIEETNAQSECVTPASDPIHDISRCSPMDTVGAVCVDADGNVASAVSSGGITLKHPGRVGQASSYGCGCWAQTGRGTVPSVACSTSGCGEHLIRTLLAKECCDGVLQSDGCTTIGIQRVFKEKFLESPFLASVDAKLGGALTLSHNPDEGVELVWAHTTESMCLAYMSPNSKAPKFQISRLPTSSTAGKSLQIQGIHC